MCVHTSLTATITSAAISLCSPRDPLPRPLTKHYLIFFSFACLLRLSRSLYRLFLLCYSCCCCCYCCCILSLRFVFIFRIFPIVVIAAVVVAPLGLGPRTRHLSDKHRWNGRQNICFYNFTVSHKFCSTFFCSFPSCLAKTQTQKLVDSSAIYLET